MAMGEVVTMGDFDRFSNHPILPMEQLEEFRTSWWQAPSMTAPLKIALLELCGFHDECLYSQVRFIKEHGDHDLHLFATERIKDRVQHFPGLDSSYFFPNEKLSLSQLLWLRRRLISEGFHKVVINSASGKNVRNFLLLPYPERLEFVGVIHDIQRLRKSFDQRLISRRIKKYFVLNDYLLHPCSRYRLGSFYPIFFPPVESQACPKREGELWVTIPGRIEARRRDYDLLFRTLKAHPVAKSTKFILLGGGSEKHGVGHEVRLRIEEMGLLDQFVMWENFVPVPTFHSYLAHSDYIMPLVSLQRNEGLRYNQQITGAFNLGIAYKIPFLMDSHFETFEDFRPNSVFYNEADLGEVLQNLTAPAPGRYYQEAKWSFEAQQERYWKLLQA